MNYKTFFYFLCFYGFLPHSANDRGKRNNKENDKKKIIKNVKKLKLLFYLLIPILAYEKLSSHISDYTFLFSFDLCLKC